MQPTLSLEQIKIKDQEFAKMLSQKRDFVSKYGKDAEKVMVGKAIEIAKKQTETMNKSRLQEIIKGVLMENNSPKFKIGDKITYLGRPAEITNVNKEMGGGVSYNILYIAKDGSKTKASNISDKALKETHDPNDPVTMAMRANRGKVQSPISTPTQRKSSGGGGKKVAKKWDLTLKDLYAQRKQIEFDMEKEAELEGGPVTDQYGAQLNKIDKQIARIRGMMKEGTASLKKSSEMIKNMSDDQKKDFMSKHNNHSIHSEEYDAASKRFDELFVDPKEWKSFLLGFEEGVKYKK